jgi:RimJ/RimL family protein N-acetyltransferase
MPPGPTQRLAFREMTASDLDAMADLLGDPEVMAFYPRPKSRAEALGWIEWNQRLYRERGFGLWAIELRDTGAFVGDCGLTPQEVDGMPEVEVGYHVRRLLQGRGYATEAAAASRDYARDVLGLGRLIAIIDPRNVPSQRVAERIGLGLEKETDWSGKRVRIHAGRP